VRRGRGIAGALAVLALAACNPDYGRVSTPTSAPPTTAAATPSTCTAANEDSVASFAPAGVDLDTARAQTIRKDRLVVGVSADTNLVGFRDENADLVGFDIDIAREIARGLFGSPDAIELKVLTVPQRIPALVNGEVDIVVNSLTVTCGRWDQINFSSEYLRAGQKLLVRADAAAAGIDTLDELAGRRVCASRGGTGAATLRDKYPAIQRVEVEDRGDCLVRFQRGEADAILNGDNLLAGFVPQDSYAARIVGDRINQEPTAIGVKKEHVTLTRAVNQALETVRAGSWQAIYDRWLLNPLPAASPPPAVYGRTT
jgi:polar amino acid transport system substrate-binding protein